MYSFSVPETLQVAAHSVVKRWFDGVLKTAEKLGLAVRLNRRLTCHPSVVL